jgi:hypothetical protein
LCGVTMQVSLDKIFRFGHKRNDHHWRMKYYMTHIVCGHVSTRLLAVKAGALRLKAVHHGGHLRGFSLWLAAWARSQAGTVFLYSYCASSGSSDDVGRIDDWLNPISR